MVVLQQGPSSVEVNRDTLRLAAKLFAPLIRAAGGVPAMLAVWPTSDRLVDFDRATESYRLAAADVGGMMIPSGEVWRAAWRRDPTLALLFAGRIAPVGVGLIRDGAVARSESSTTDRSSDLPGDAAAPRWQRPQRRSRQRRG